MTENYEVGKDVANLQQDVAVLQQQMAQVIRELHTSEEVDADK